MKNLSRHELFSLRYFIVFYLLVTGVFVYAGMTGWKILDTTPSEKHSNAYGTSHYYHK